MCSLLDQVGEEDGIALWTKKICHLRGSNTGPSDLQSDALPAELKRPCYQQFFGITNSVENFDVYSTEFLISKRSKHSISFPSVMLFYCKEKLQAESSMGIIYFPKLNSARSNKSISGVKFRDLYDQSPIDVREEAINPPQVCWSKPI